MQKYVLDEILVLIILLYEEYLTISSYRKLNNLPALTVILFNWIKEESRFVK